MNKGLTALSFIFISACSTHTEIPLAEKRIIPYTKEGCIKEGGQWGQFGIPGGSYSCSLKTNDFGKTCKDSSHCEGICLTKVTPDSNHEFIGSCSKYLTKFGFYQYIENGKIIGICLD